MVSRTTRVNSLGHTILVVDDNLQLLRVICRKLQLEGYQVHASSSGDEAREKVGHREPPDVVLTDAVIPRLIQGQDFAQLMKSSLPRLRVIRLLDFVEVEGLTQLGFGFIDIFENELISLSD